MIHPFVTSGLPPSPVAEKAPKGSALDSRRPTADLVVVVGIVVLVAIFARTFLAEGL
jgi:hypothetical protein